MSPGEVVILKAAFRWARRLGWRRQTQIKTEWCWSRAPEARSARGNTVSFSMATGELVLIIWGYGQPVVLGVQHALDLLATYNILPKTFSSAYAAGIRQGMAESEAMAEQVIEDSVTNQIDLLLAGLGTPEGMRTLGDLIERHPHGVALSSVPFERRAQLEAIADSVGSLMGVDQA